MEQYPDSIAIILRDSSTQDPTTGVWTMDGSPDVHTLKCRAEKNLSGKQIVGRDGSMHDYAFICYTPKTSLLIPVGTEYILTSSKNGVFSGTIKDSFNAQLNTRIWL